MSPWFVQRFLGTGKGFNCLAAALTSPSNPGFPAGPGWEGKGSTARLRSLLPAEGILPLTPNHIRDDQGAQVGKSG